jgi:exportin-2 (importin alpha re-exporter)
MFKRSGQTKSKSRYRYQQLTIAEEELKRFETIEGFTLLLISLIIEKQVTDDIKVLAAITLKNFVKRNWSSIKSGILSKSEREQLKSNIVNLMLSTSGTIRSSLSETVSVISNVDFYREWPQLLPEIIERLKTNDLKTILGLLQTLESIIGKYRGKEETEELVDEVQYFINGFAPVLLNFMKGFVEQLNKNLNNDQAILSIMQCFEPMVEIFYTVNSINLVDFFENNIQAFMTILLFLLKFNHKAIQDSDEEKPDLSTRIKTTIVDVLNIYSEKYLEEFNPFLNEFTQTVWELLTKTSTKVKYDGLMSKSLYFLTLVCKGPSHKLFAQENTLRGICENIVIPNLTLRAEDVETFKDDAVEYIRRDIEGSDTDTRRRAASELVQGLIVNFEKTIFPILWEKSSMLLKSYTDDNKNWKAKDTATYLVVSISIKTKTVKKGATSLAGNFVPSDYFGKNLMNDLMDDKQPILRADALKYINSFRNYFTKDMYGKLLPAIINALTSKFKVVHTYAAWTLEKVLAMQLDGKPMFSPNELGQLAKSLLTNLFGIINSVEESKDNEYIMKCIMRVTIALGSAMEPFLEIYVHSLASVLQRVCLNSKSPDFNRYLFESFATVIKFNPKHNDQFEKALMGTFLTILSKNIEEFIPYVFQIMSQLFDVRTTPSEHMVKLFPQLLQHGLWENSGNVPGLVNLIGTYLKKTPDLVLNGGHLKTILGIFTTLVGNKTLDHEGFHILNCIVENLSLDKFSAYTGGIFGALFTRLSSKKTLKFVKCLIVFFSLFVVKFGTEVFARQMEGLQKGIFNNVLGLWADNITKISGTEARRLVGIATVKLLTDSTLLVNEFFEVQRNNQRVNNFNQILIGLLMLVELKEDQSVDDLFDVEQESVEYQVRFAKLTWTSSSTSNPIKDYPPVKNYLAISLAKCFSSSSYKQRAQSVISTFGNQPLTSLAEYFTASNLDPNMLRI